MARVKRKQPQVERDEIQTLELQDHPFRCITEAQSKAWETIQSNTITFLIGSAGAGKTQVATAFANQAVAVGKYKRVIHTRPVVEATENLGWLPGTLEAKLQPYMAPLSTCSQKASRRGVEPMVIPLAYMRGLTLEHCIGILDEAQNATYSQLKLYLTRLGNNAKLIICGDEEQCDISNSGLAVIARELAGLDGIGIHEFQPCDSVRHPLVEKMLQRFTK